VSTGRLRLATAALCITAAVAAAADVPIAGKSVRVGAATAAKRTIAFASEVASTIAAPFPDPTTGAALRVFVSNGVGQCHTVRDCQAVQMAQYIEATHDVPTLAMAVGDFNSEPGTYVYQQFASRGWTDTYLAAGNPECVTATAVGCTSGRMDETLTDIENPALNQPSASTTCGSSRWDRRHSAPARRSPPAIPTATASRRGSSPTSRTRSPGAGRRRSPSAGAPTTPASRPT